MARTLIIGSGAAAAGAALALSRSDETAITVIDIGLQLEPERQAAVDTLAVTPPERWDPEVVDGVAVQPVRSTSGGLPQKRLYGSDYPFRDVGQLEGLVALAGANRSIVSAAYGGFSNVWGAQLMPFAASVFATWPVSFSEMEPHYREVLREVPYAAESDDLARIFPLLGPSASLPPPSSRTDRVLTAYGRNRTAINRLGINVGKARLAFAAPSCVRCGLCMTGCPYSLIYSATQTFDRLRSAGRVTYHGGLMALRVSEEGDHCTVVAQDIRTGEVHEFAADRVFVACGAVGTTRLIANSLGLFDMEVGMLESQQFALPFVSRLSTPDPQSELQFTLNQFNLTVAFDERGFDLSQLHFYTYNPAFEDALPWPLRVEMAEPIRRQVMRRLSFALGYLPSWRSPALAVRVSPPRANNALPELTISSASGGAWRNPMMRSVITLLMRSARGLDLYPVVPMLRTAGAGKSYHVGGSFPHREGGQARLTTDRVGRPAQWQRIHLVDASVFPSVPATTFMLTVMANAHRIASESIALPS